MNYELAKELKDAGFFSGKGSIVFDTSTGPVLKRDSLIKTPTLSELIEACEPNKSDDFLINLMSGEWRARLIYHGYFEGWVGVERDSDGMVNIDITAFGATPEEAVARLWLALNPTRHTQ